MIPLTKMLQASLKFDFILFFIFDDLHLQIIESISPKASVGNSSVQRAIFFSQTSGLIYI